MTDAFDDLIARLEAATVPDPHLDAEIEALLCGGTPAYRHGLSRLHQPSDVLVGDAKWHAAPSFTGSVDAALTLVPLGMDWSVVRRTRHPYRGIFPFEAVVWDVRQQGFAHTGPMALCAAALRARAPSLRAR